MVVAFDPMSASSLGLSNLDTTVSSNAPANMVTALLDLTDGIETGMTPRQALRLLCAILGGNTWVGAGALGKIEQIEEGLALESRGIRMTLSGIPTTIASAVLSEPMVFRPVKIYTAIYNRDTHALIDTPVLEWSGLLDSAQLVTQARE